MLNKNILKQMLKFHKTTLENSFSISVMLQCQAENIFNFFRHFSGMSDEAKKVMDRRVIEYKSGIDDLKKSMDKGYAIAEDFYKKNSRNIFQEQTAKIIKVYLGHAKCMPPDMKKTMEEIAVAYKAGCEAFRKYIDKNIGGMTDYLHSNDNLRIKKEQMKTSSARFITMSNS